MHLSPYQKLFTICIATYPKLGSSSSIEPKGERIMPGRSKTIFSLGAALASLAGAQAISTEAQATSVSTDAIAPTNDAVSKQEHAF